MTSTSSRLLLLLSLLQTRRDWPGAALADRLHVSDRTVRRDVDRLREMGYTIRASMGPDGGYRLDAGTELPPLLFDDDQAVALAVALQAVTGSGVEIEEAAVRALTTVRQVLPSRLRHRLDSLDFTTLPPRAGEPVSPEVLVTLSAAIRAREVLRFDYASARVAAQVEPARRVEPHHLVASRGRWYLVAWDLEREAWRTFRADRIAPRMPTGPRFTPRDVPGGDVAAYVSAQFQGADARDGWPCRGTAIIGLPAAEVRPYAGDAVVEDVGGGRCRIAAGSWSWVGLAALLGRFDADVEVVGPADLAQAFGVLAERYAATAAARR